MLKPTSRSDELQNMVRVCDNANQQYKRTRPDPSARSIRRAKELVTHVVHPLVLAQEYFKLQSQLQRKKASRVPVQ